MEIELDFASYHQPLDSLGAEIAEVLHHSEVLMVYV
jgi:hypothetical protein